MLQAKKTIGLLTVVVFAAACGGGSRGSTVPAAPAGSGKAAPKGLAQAFVVDRSFTNLVPVAGGLFGASYPLQGSPGEQGQRQEGQRVTISEFGITTPLPPELSVDAWTSTGSGDLVAVGTVKSSDPLAASTTQPEQLLVLQMPSGRVKKAVPLGMADREAAEVTGVVNNMAVLSIGGGVGSVQRLVAYDLGGAKRWDVQVEVDGTVTAQIAGDVLLTSVNLPYPSQGKSVTGRRVRDGSIMWTATRPVGLLLESDGLPSTRVGKTVFYDAGGAAWAISTGAAAGPGGSGSVGEGFDIRNSAIVDDDIILSYPLRRVTPAGREVWSLLGTSGTVAAAGGTLLALGTDALVALDPATGKRLTQVSATADTLQIVGKLAITEEEGLGYPTMAYSIGRL